VRACEVDECRTIEEAVAIERVAGNCSCLDQLELEALLFLHSIEYYQKRPSFILFIKWRKNHMGENLSMAHKASSSPGSFRTTPNQSISPSPNLSLRGASTTSARPKKGFGTG
jgi:hypothetical protein